MISTSCEWIAQELLDRCLAGKAPLHLPHALLQEACAKALFRILVEGLADRFEPSLCDVYARLFSQVVAHVVEDVSAEALVARYERVRRPRPILSAPRRILVLSRVTLGADVAVTSVLLAAAKQRFPKARVIFAGPQKNYELFAGDRRIRHYPLEYRRGSLRDRLAVWEELWQLTSAADCVVIDSDSRLTQLGLLPVCAEERHHLFESRGYGEDTDRALPELAADWAAATFGVSGARPYVALKGQINTSPIKRAPGIAVNLGVGENPSKRIGDPFEERLIALLAATGQPLVVDKGGDREEAARVEGAVERAGVKAEFWDGPFAGFAKIIAGSRLYVGYDSAGQHVAAACGVPLISIFAGFPVPRMVDRWKPTGPRSTVIRVDRPDPDETLERVRHAMALALPGTVTVDS